MRLFRNTTQRERDEILAAAAEDDLDEAAAARARVLGLAAAPGRVYISAAGALEAPLLTPGQAARGHGGRP